jgi:hypothetical protein
VGRQLRDLNQVKADLARLGADQDRIRKNLAATPRKEEVYETYLGRLAEQEREIDGLTDREAALMTSVFQARKSFVDYLANLSDWVAVGRRGGTPETWTEAVRSAVRLAAQDDPPVHRYSDVRPLDRVGPGGPEGAEAVVVRRHDLNAGPRSVANQMFVAQHADFEDATDEA